MTKQHDSSARPAGHWPSRRDVLKTAGAVGLLSTVGLSGTAAADHTTFGNGNAIGQFLNERAQGKAHPIWTSGIADATGQGTVSVDVGTMTSIDIPPEALPPGLPPELVEALVNATEGPFGFTPRAVEVSTGTTVVWNWTGNPFEPFHPTAPWPHDVASLDVHGEHDHLFQSPGQALGSYPFTFDEPGVYLYFCHPHGYPHHDHEEFEFNLFGMRGAVVVTDE